MFGITIESKLPFILSEPQGKVCKATKSCKSNQYNEKPKKSHYDSKSALTKYSTDGFSAVLYTSKPFVTRHLRVLGPIAINL